MHYTLPVLRRNFYSEFSTLVFGPSFEKFLDTALPTDTIERITLKPNRSPHVMRNSDSEAVICIKLLDTFLNLVYLKE